MGTRPRIIEPRMTRHQPRAPRWGWARWLAVAALACAAAACDTETETPATTLAGLGEECADTVDCADGLKCIALTCLVADVPDVAGGADVAAGDDGGPGTDTTPDPDVAEPFDAGPALPSTNPDDIDDQTPAISGRVLYSVDQTPIASALVTGAPGLGNVLTNAAGQYLFVGSDAAPITAGSIYEIAASRAAFVGNAVYVTAKAGHNRDVDILLDPVVVDPPLGANPSTLTFDLSTFGASSTAIKQVVLFLNPAKPGVTSVDFTVSVPEHDAIWLSVKPATGKVGKTKFTLIVTVDRAGLQGGIQGSFAILAPGGDPLIIPVKVVSGTQ